MMEYIRPTSFLVEPKSIVYDISTNFEDSNLKHNLSISFGGRVKVSDPLLEGTSVDATIWAGDNELAQELQSEGFIGDIIISKHFFKFKELSDDPMEPYPEHLEADEDFQSSSLFAGINISILLLEEQFFKLRDSIALADSSQLTFNIGCTSDQFIYSSRASSGELLLENKDLELKIISYGFRFMFHNCKK